MAGTLQPPQLGRNPFHSGNFSKRTVGNSGNFSDCSPDLFDLADRKFIASLSLKSSCAHGWMHVSLDSIISFRQ